VSDGQPQAFTSEPTIEVPPMMQNMSKPRRASSEASLTVGAGVAAGAQLLSD